MGRTKGPEIADIKGRLKKPELCKRGHRQELMASSNASGERSLLLTQRRANGKSLSCREAACREKISLQKEFVALDPRVSMAGDLQSHARSAQGWLVRMPQVLSSPGVRAHQSGETEEIAGGPGAAGF